MGTIRLARRGLILGVIGLLTLVATSAAAAPPSIIGAPRFVLTMANGQAMTFTELSGISSKVSSLEYIYNDDSGQTIHTKQFGKTAPPSVTLKRPLDATDNILFAWHQEARAGKPGARQNVTLTITDAQGKTQMTYLLENAWASKLEMSSMKAGASDVAMITLVLTCERIIAE